MQLVKSLEAFIQANGPQVSYIFDDISRLAQQRGDFDAFDLFRGINPKLQELKAVSYWPLVRNSVYQTTIAKFSGIAQLLLSVERTDKGICIHPLKVPSKKFHQMLKPWFFDFESFGLKRNVGSSAVLTLLMRKVAEADRLRQELYKSERKYLDLLESTTLYKNIVGGSEHIRGICKLIGIAAGSDVTVLIQGESGTGKELVAEAIHYHSSRSTGPFVKVNCAAVSETLLESELFGHRKGAFTGAIRDQKGKFRLGDGGTILLDEIGCMSLTGQAKLLRVLQNKEIEPVGGSRPIKVDVRIIATTNLNLERAIDEGRFREDLYYRLNIFPICLLPLRERKEDISDLAGYFLKKYSHEIKKPVGEISPEASAIMQEYDWPGNIRELENAIEYAILIEKGEVLRSISLSQRIPDTLPDNSASESLDLRAKLRDIEKETILKALRQANGVKKQAARMLGIDPKNLAYFLKKHLVE